MAFFTVRTKFSIVHILVADYTAVKWYTGKFLK